MQSTQKRNSFSSNFAIALTREAEKWTFHLETVGVLILCKSKSRCVGTEVQVWRSNETVFSLNILLTKLALQDKLYKRLDRTTAHLASLNSHGQTYKLFNIYPWTPAYNYYNTYQRHSKHRGSKHHRRAHKLPVRKFNVVGRWAFKLEVVVSQNARRPTTLNLPTGNLWAQRWCFEPLCFECLRYVL